MVLTGIVNGKYDLFALRFISGFQYNSAMGFSWGRGAWNRLGSDKAIGWRNAPLLRNADSLMNEGRLKSWWPELIKADEFSTDAIKKTR
jgi:hypothetical protein